MTFIVFLRCVADGGFYYFFAVIAASVFGARPGALALGLAVQSLALTAGYLLRGKRVRFITLALPALYIAFGAEGAAERVALLPMLIHMANVLRSERYEPTWDQEAGLFSKFWKIVLAMTFVWFSFGSLVEGGWRLLTSALLPGAAVTLTAMILLTRALRHDRDIYVSGRRQLVDIAIFALLLLISAILSSGTVLRGAAGLARAFFGYVIYPVLEAVVWVVGQLLRLVGLLLSLIFKDAVFEAPKLPGSGGTPVGEAGLEGAQKAGEASPLLRAALIVAGAAALVFLAYKLIKALTLRGPELVERDGPNIERTSIARTVEKREKGGERTDIERIRREYRRFLRLCGQRGIGLRARDTSLSVEEKSAGAFEAEDVRALRDVYIAARYDGAAGPEGVEVAQEAVKRARKGS